MQEVWRDHADAIACPPGITPDPPLKPIAAHAAFRLVS